jgi:hypothetical protein
VPASREQEPPGQRPIPPRLPQQLPPPTHAPPPHPQQRNAAFWREKWNFQNFKLNVLADMLVLRLIEADPSLAAPPGSGAGSEAGAPAAVQQQQHQQAAGGWAADAAPREGKGGAAGRGKAQVVAVAAAGRGFRDDEDDFGGEASLEELTL